MIVAIEKRKSVFICEKHIVQKFWLGPSPHIFQATAWNKRITENKALRYNAVVFQMNI